MKRILAILLLMSYSLASFGVSLNYMYCCGKLKTVSIGVVPAENVLAAENKGCKGKATKGCCDKKTVTIKLKADQQKSQYQSLARFATVFTPVILHNDNYLIVPVAGNGSVNPLYKRPPPVDPRSRHLLFCVFRI